MLKILITIGFILISILWIIEKFIIFIKAPQFKSVIISSDYWGNITKNKKYEITDLNQEGDILWVTFFADDGIVVKFDTEDWCVHLLNNILE